MQTEIHIHVLSYPAHHLQPKGTPQHLCWGISRISVAPFRLSPDAQREGPSFHNRICWTRTVSIRGCPVQPGSVPLYAVPGCRMSGRHLVAHVPHSPFLRQNSTCSLNRRGPACSGTPLQTTSAKALCPNPVTIPSSLLVIRGSPASALLSPKLQDGHICVCLAYQ